MDFGKIFMRQGILLGHFLCDRVQGVESFATYPSHIPSQVPPSPAIMFENYSKDYKVLAPAEGEAFSFILS